MKEKRPARNVNDDRDGDEVCTNTSAIRTRDGEKRTELVSTQRSQPVKPKAKNRRSQDMEHIPTPKQAAQPKLGHPKRPFGDILA